MLRLVLSARFIKSANKLLQSEFEQAQAALQILAERFGNAHRHAGLGIRKLRFNGFECRLNQNLRSVFFFEPGVLRVYDIMTHEEVSRFVRNL